MRIGANNLGDGRCEFCVWAPLLDEVALRIVSPEEYIIPMEKDRQGYWRVVVNQVFPRTLYLYRLDGNLDRPDPASGFPFQWEDRNWSGIPLKEMIIYELHVGTFTRDGSFEAIIPKLDDLCDLGITAINIMPVAQFPGGRNWGYDGVHLG